MRVQLIAYEFGMEDGWEFEDNLPKSLSDTQYARMYPMSQVDLVRIFPYVTTLRGREYIEVGSLLAFESKFDLEPVCLFTGTLNPVDIPDVGNNGIWMDITFVYSEILDD